MTLPLSPSFRQLEAPGTGRRVLQLTTGPGFCYPLYYYVPSVTRDDRYVVYHRAAEGEVQLHRVDLATGEWFYENHGPDVHELQLLERHDPTGSDTWLDLTGNWPTYGDPDSQKAHFHPQVVLDRKWILMTGGDATTETNQVCLLDISDLTATRGIPWPASDSAPVR